VSPPRPTQEDMLALAAYLPRLYAEGFQPLRRWPVTVDRGDGFVHAPPGYDPLVLDFVREASRPCWEAEDYDWDRDEAMLQDPEAVSRADIDQIRSMLTCFVRVERFCEGSWALMIGQGHIRRLLERVAELAQQEAAAGR